MLRSTPAGGYAGCCTAVASLDLRDGLARIELPTLVASAAHDTALPREHGLAIAAGVPGARFALIERAAHIANVEQPEVVNRLILDHLAGSGDV
jgi:3-oxoadipate enol-lactonase